MEKENNIRELIQKVMRERRTKEKKEKGVDSEREEWAASGRKERYFKSRRGTNSNLIVFITLPVLFSVFDKQKATQVSK